MTNNFTKYKKLFLNKFLLAFLNFLRMQSYLDVSIFTYNFLIQRSRICQPKHLITHRIGLCVFPK